MSAEKISEHIFAPTRGCCIHYPQSIILFTYQVGILIDFVPNFKKVNHTGYVGENFDILSSPPKTYLLESAHLAKTASITSNKHF